MQENILSKLLTECPFPEVFEDTEKVEGCSLPAPRRKIGPVSYTHLTLPTNSLV